jgi:hypothetical protein
MVKKKLYVEQSYRQDNDNYADMVSHQHLVVEYWLFGIKVYKFEKDILPYPGTENNKKKGLGY